MAIHLELSSIPLSLEVFGSNTSCCLSLACNTRCIQGHPFFALAIFVGVAVTLNPQPRGENIFCRNAKGLTAHQGYAELRLRWRWQKHDTMPGCASDRSLCFDTNNYIRNWSVTTTLSATDSSNGGAYGSMLLLSSTTVMTSTSISAAAIFSSSGQVTNAVGQYSFRRLLRPRLLHHLPLRTIRVF